MAWSVVSLPSILSARVRFLAWSGILIFILGWECPSSCVVFNGGPDILAYHTFRDVALVYLSNVLVQSVVPTQ